MLVPFNENYFSWAILLIMPEYNIIMVALPPKEDIPFVMGNLEKVMDILKKLVRGFDNPTHDMLPIRLVMLPSCHR